MDTTTTPTLHADGTVTYWSAYRQQWIEYATSVDEECYAIMSEEERVDVDEHLKRHWPGDAEKS